MRLKNPYNARRHNGNCSNLNFFLSPLVHTPYLVLTPSLSHSLSISLFEFRSVATIANVYYNKLFGRFFFFAFPALFLIVYIICINTLLYRQHDGGVKRLKNFHVLKRYFYWILLTRELLVERCVSSASQPASRVKINTPFHYLKNRAVGWGWERRVKNRRKEKEKVK